MGRGGPTGRPDHDDDEGEDADGDDDDDDQSEFLDIFFQEQVGWGTSITSKVFKKILHGMVFEYYIYNKGGLHIIMKIS